MLFDNYIRAAAAEPRWHQLSWSQFDELAGGLGGAQASSVLRSAQASKRLLMLWSLVGQVHDSELAVAAREDVERLFDILAALWREHPGEVEAVVLHPPVGTWLHHCLRRLRPRPGQTSGPSLPSRSGQPPQAAGQHTIEEDLGYLGGLVAAIALRARIPVDIHAPVRAGVVTLPTYGQIRLRGQGDRARIRIWAHTPDPAGRIAMRLAVDTADDHVQLTSRSLEYTDTDADADADTDADRERDDSPTNQSPGHHPDRWWPVRPLQLAGASGGSPIVLDDLDPFREPGALEPTRRLTAAEFRHWRAVFDEAWHLLVRDHPHRVDGVAGLLRSLVPLAAPAGVTSVSASSLEAFGSVLLSAPTDSAQLAVTLIHETQHSKLAAIDDLSPLVARRSPAVHYAPWRLDPRPVEGLLHGAFAFLAVAGYWYERSLIDEGGQALLAAYEFVWCRESVRDVVATLETDETLTPAGRRLTAGIADQVRRWSGAAVPELAHRLGMLEVGDCRVRWRLRNLTPEPEVISSWARAWLRGDPCPPSGAPVCGVRAGTPSAAGGNRVDVARRLLAGETVDVSGRARADVLLLTGRAEEAAAEYRRAVHADGDALAAWSGLVLSRLGTGGRSARGYSTRPETVRALWLAIRRASGDTPDLDALAAWIADVDDADTRRSRPPAVERPGRAGRAVVNPRTA